MLPNQVHHDSVFTSVVFGRTTAYQARVLGSIPASGYLAFYNYIINLSYFVCTLEKKLKKSVLTGDSDDEDEPNTYDYHDSFIDDEGIGGI